jgi:hypothetical protein
MEPAKFGWDSRGSLSTLTKSCDGCFGILWFFFPFITSFTMPTFYLRFYNYGSRRVLSFIRTMLFYALCICSILVSFITACTKSKGWKLRTGVCFPFLIVSLLLAIQGTTAGNFAATGVAYIFHPSV